jgi:hypothetical protein
MTYPSIDLKTVYLKPDEAFTVEVESFGDTREVYIWLHEDGALTFNDEHFAERPSAQTECMAMDEDAGWVLYDEAQKVTDDHG